MKKYFLTAAFAVLAASPALAASTHHARNSAGPYAAAEDFSAYAQPDAYTVLLNGKVLGRDPDAFIRQSLLREGDHSEQSSD